MTDKTNEFIDKAIQIHGDKYNYSKVEYINAKTKVQIICKEHGEFLQTPNKHLMGQGCSKCGKETISNRFRTSTNDFINKSMQIHGDKYNYSKVQYINAKTKVIIICKKHGEFLQSPNNHLYGYGCINCRNENSGNSQRLTNNDFINKAKQIHGDKYDYSKVQYINSHLNVKIICNIHGEFNQKPNNHLNGE